MTGDVIFSLTLSQLSYKSFCVLSLVNYGIDPATSCMLTARSTNSANFSYFVCTHVVIFLFYNPTQINHTYSITLKQYSFHHPNEYSTQNIHYSINHTQSPTTYQNISILIIYSPEITHHFYPEIIHIHCYLHFRLYTKK